MTLNEYIKPLSDKGFPAQAPSRALSAQPWREVIRPHPDIASGAFGGRDFRADLHAAMTGLAAFAAGDPIEFFARTHVTGGLNNLLCAAAARLDSDLSGPAVAVVGGSAGIGKTHALIALVHAARGQLVLGFSTAERRFRKDQQWSEAIRVAALDCRHLDPVVPDLKYGASDARTIWAELAWQLGGPRALAQLARSGSSSADPGAGLTALLARYSPCLIVIDDWAEYACKVAFSDEPGPAGGLGTQLEFAQALTEAADATPGVFVAVSLPSLPKNDPTNLQTVAHQLQVVLGDVHMWQPPTGLEQRAIVLRRIFELPTPQSRRDAAEVSATFLQFYGQNATSFVAECGYADYDRRIRESYPIHHELFASVFENRTGRVHSGVEPEASGVGRALRLLSPVVHALWISADISALVMPGSIPLASPRVLSEFAPAQRYSEWKAIVAADVDGPASLAASIGENQPELGHASPARRIARSILLHSLSGRKVSRAEAHTGAAVPGDTIRGLTAALDLLVQSGAYLHSDGDRYWFDRQPRLTKIARQLADQLGEHPDLVWDEVMQRLSERHGAAGSDFARIIVAPKTSADVPDVQELTLVILHPRYSQEHGPGESAAMAFARRCVEMSGSARRAYRNSVLFLAPDGDRLTLLEGAARDLMAWVELAGAAAHATTPDEQLSEIAIRCAAAEREFHANLRSTYVWALSPERLGPREPLAIRVLPVGGTQVRLSDRLSSAVEHGDQLASSYDARNVRLDLEFSLQELWSPKGYVSVGLLVSSYARRPELTRFACRAVLESAVRSVLVRADWESSGFALATGVSDDKFDGLVLPGPTASFGPITDSTLLVHPALALSTRASEFADGTRRPERANGHRTGLFRRRLRGS